MPTYDDGSTPTLVTEKPPAVAMTQYGEDVAGTLTARHDSSPCADRGQNIIAIQGDGGTSSGAQRGSGVNESGASYTLSCMDRHSVAYVLKVRGGADTYVKQDGTVGTAGKGALTSEEVTFTVAATQDQTMFEPTGAGYVVRRLTPTECERLQGFPDGWTDLTGCDANAVTESVAASLHYDEKKSAALLRKVRKWSEECPDGPRYKACGNSMAVPVMRWIGERIQEVDALLSSEGDADSKNNQEKSD